MEYFKLETAQETLRKDYGAKSISMATRGSVRAELWRRAVQDHSYTTFLQWEHGEELVSEEDLRAAAEAMRIEPDDFLRKIKERGGYWTGPGPRR